jgi:hypothetical protein
MVMTMRNAVFWDVTQWDSCKNRRFERTCRLHIRVTRIGELETMLAVTDNRSTLGINTMLQLTLVLDRLFFSP